MLTHYSDLYNSQNAIAHIHIRKIPESMSRDTYTTVLCIHTYKYPAQV